MKENTDASTVWKKVNKINGKYSPKPAPSLKVNNAIVNKPEEVAQVFAKNFSEICLTSAARQQDLYRKSQIKLKRVSVNKGVGHWDNLYLNAPFTLEELKQQLSI